MSEPDASSTVKGITYLDFDPDVPTSPIAVGINSSRLEKVLSADYGNSLATAISAISTTPVTLIVKEDSDVSTSVTVPENIWLEFRNGAKLIKISSGAVEFEGLGLVNANTQIPCFEAFEPGDVIWSGDFYPNEISTEILETNNDSLTERLDFVDAALEGKSVKIAAYPRTFTASSTLTEFHHLHFNAGDYFNVVDTFTGPLDPVNPPIAFSSNTAITGDGTARLYVSGIDNNTFMFYSAGGISDSLENVIIQGLHFIGGDASEVTPAHSHIITGNLRNGLITDNIFEGIQSYPVIVGGDGGTGNCADNVIVDRNILVDCWTQGLNVINGKNISICGNIFNYRGDYKPLISPTNLTAIDLEPNSPGDILENILVADNIIDARYPDPTTGQVSGVFVQGGNTIGARNITVRDNKFIGVDEANNADMGNLITGVQAHGTIGLTVSGNEVKSAFQAAMTIFDCREIRCVNNILNNVNLANSNTLTLLGISNSDISGNIIYRVMANVYQFQNIFEDELYFPVTASGSVVTGLIGGGFYDFWRGLLVTVNANDYIVQSTTNSPQTLTMTASVGTLAQKTFHTVSTLNDTISITGHGFNDLAAVRISGGSLPGGFVSGDFLHVIKVDNNTIKLATSLENAIANNPINITSTGSGSLDFALRTKFSNNTYRDNKASQGIKLEATGSSVIYSDYLRTVSDFVSPAQITANQNNYDPGRSAYRLDLSTNASRNLTGLVFSMAQVNGEKHVIYNAGSNDIVLKHQDTGSSAENRFKNSTGSDLTLTPGQAADLEYLGGSVLRWAVFKRN